jgi:hypothetical protein
MWDSESRVRQFVIIDLMSHKLSTILENCTALRQAYDNGLLGNQIMPEDTHPEFKDLEDKLSFYTLPMSLNYQRNSYSLWTAATSSHEDDLTRSIFNVNSVATMPDEQLRRRLLKYKVALQPNKHTHTWRTIATTISQEWGSIERMLEAADYDFLKLQDIIQKVHKKSFPYLSGPKIFHYWSYILGEYCGITLKNKNFIEIAPDTHVIKCSIILGVLSEKEALTMTRDAISARWREVLKDSELSPIDMHSPLWFWSKNDFSYILEN